MHQSLLKPQAGQKRPILSFSGSDQAKSTLWHADLPVPMCLASGFPNAHNACGSQMMKAGLDAVIGTFAAQPEVVGQLWDRLLSAVVVQPFTAQEHAMLGATIHYDITYQLREIEVSSQSHHRA